MSCVFTRVHRSTQVFAIFENASSTVKMPPLSLSLYIHIYTYMYIHVNIFASLTLHIHTHKYTGFCHIRQRVLCFKTPPLSLPFCIYIYIYVCICTHVYASLTLYTYLHTNTQAFAIFDNASSAVIGQEEFRSTLQVIGSWHTCEQVMSHAWTIYIYTHAHLDEAHITRRILLAHCGWLVAVVIFWQPHPFKNLGPQTNVHTHSVSCSLPHTHHINTPTHTYTHTQDLGLELYLW